MSKEKHSKKSAKTKAVLIIIFSIILIGSIGYLTYNFYQQWSQKQDTDSVASDIENAVETAKTYGDQLITLSTCDYHVEDGRFAVVAKKISNSDVTR